jgi:hypothetical protein
LTRLAEQWLADRKALRSLLSPKGWLAVQSSTLFYGSRACWQGAQSLLYGSALVGKSDGD